MKSILGMAALALALWLATAGSAPGQCRGGGGGSPASAGSGAASFASSGGGELFTSPGSWAYDMMVQQAVMQVYAQRQAALTAERAQREAQAKAARAATHQQRRQSELARRARYREYLATSAKQ
jgi:hypothetical protein